MDQAFPSKSTGSDFSSFHQNRLAISGNTDMFHDCQSGRVRVGTHTNQEILPLVGNSGRFPWGRGEILMKSCCSIAAVLIMGALAQTLFAGEEVDLDAGWPLRPVVSTK